MQKLTKYDWRAKLVSSTFFNTFIEYALMRIRDLNIAQTAA
jgi:hypothetical protein